MELTASVADVADRLEAAFRQGPQEGQALLGALYAEQVELRHVPALPNDGIVGGPRLAEGSAREAAAIRSALPDMRYEDVAVSVDAGCVRVTVAIVGTLATGATVRLPADMRCTVREGRIVGMEHHLGAEAMAAWSELARAGGLSPAPPDNEGSP